MIFLEAADGVIERSADQPLRCCAARWNSYQVLHSVKRPDASTLQVLVSVDSPFRVNRNVV